MLKRSCAAYRGELAAYLDGELGSGKARRVAAHLADCAGCRREADLLRSAVQGLRAWPPIALPDGFERRFAERLDALRRERAFGRPQPGFAARCVQALRPRFALALTAACAALVVVAGVVGVRHGSGPTTERMAVARDIDLFMHLDVIQNSEALEHFELISMLDVLGQEYDE
jgi:anti-sigma factor RsiW